MAKSGTFADNRCGCVSFAFAKDGKGLAMLASLQCILDWSTGGSIHYMTLYHCMQRDML